jgi:hypothetical protein
LRSRENNGSSANRSDSRKPATDLPRSLAALSRLSRVNTISATRFAHLVNRSGLYALSRLYHRSKKENSGLFSMVCQRLSKPVPELKRILMGKILESPADVSLRFLREVSTDGLHTVTALITDTICRATNRGHFESAVFATPPAKLLDVARYAKTNHPRIFAIIENVASSEESYWRYREFLGAAWIGDICAWLRFCDESLPKAAFFTRQMLSTEELQSVVIEKTRSIPPHFLKSSITTLQPYLPEFASRLSLLRT